MRPNACADCFMHLGCLTAPAPGSKYCDYHDMLRDRMKLIDKILEAEIVMEQDRKSIEEVKLIVKIITEKMERYKEKEEKEAA